MMGFELTDGLGWRAVVLVVAALIGVYLVLSVIRLFHVAGKRRKRAPQDTMVEFSGWKPAAPVDAPTLPPGSAAPESGATFDHLLARSSVEVELDRLRRESVHQREELARLTDEVSRLKAARNVSPLYNEATALAQQGMPASGIAGHCGISIGEAELVAALARGGSEFEHHGQDEDRDERNTHSGN
jgi:hypothetical protein